MPVDDERVDLERLGHDLIRDQSDRACRAAFPGDREVGSGHRLEPDGLPHPLGHLGRGHVVDAPAALENEVREERLEIGQEQEVADETGRDGSVVREPVPERGMEGRHQDRVRRVDSRGDRVAHHAVHVAVVGDVLGVAVVGAERDPVRPVLAHERQQRLQVARHRGLADEEPDACAKALAPLLDRQHLVVRADARGGVRLQRLAEHAGRVPVDVVAPSSASFASSVSSPAMTPGKFIISARPSTRLRRMSASRSPSSSGRRGDSKTEAGTHEDGHEEDLELEARRRVMEPVDTVRPEHVCDLVRIGDDRRRPERQDQPGELVGEQLGRLDVHVRVDQPGDDVAPGGVDLLPPLVRAETGDEAVDDRDVGLEPFAREDGQDSAATHDEISGLVPAGDCETPCERRHRVTLSAVVGAPQRGPGGRGARQAPAATRTKSVAKPRVRPRTIPQATRRLRPRRRQTSSSSITT